jgi:nucleosome binding factor SPN SPT16 subunit
MLTRAVDEGDDSDESGSFEDDESGEDWDELERKAKKCTCGSVCCRVITDRRAADEKHHAGGGGDSSDDGRTKKKGGRR